MTSTNLTQYDITFTDNEGNTRDASGTVDDLVATLALYEYAGGSIALLDAAGWTRGYVCADGYSMR